MNKNTKTKKRRLNNHQKAWVVAVDMGYGHHRAAYSLKNIAYKGKTINASNYPGMPRRDRKIWRETKKFYEFISRFQRVPVIGKKAFDIFDKFQEIMPFYPKRDLSKPNLQLREIDYLIKKNSWGKHLISKLEKKPLPLIATFPIPAMMAEMWGYSGEIYCVICDADISRTWVPPNPAKSRIKYFASNYRVVERLKLYGVKTENIFLTGFPLPPELTGGRFLGTLRNDLGYRLLNLDPKKKYLPLYHKTIIDHLGVNKCCPQKPNHPLTLMFAVGGAGAQRDLGIEIVKSLSQKIKTNKIRIILVAGIRNEVNRFFRKKIKSLGLGRYLDKNIKTIFAANREDYFRKFNRALRTVDILWTKPSELSFYTALGLPIIIAPPLGSQERFNEKWLMTIGSGIPQEDVRYTNEWLFDWLESGWFAEAAMQGFMEGGKYGTYNIEKIIKHRAAEVKEVKTVLQY